MMALRNVSRNVSEELLAATIKDIARKLNISTSTVSYALNGGPRPVPEDIRLKVIETAKELQYRPNRIARSLITRRSYTIGVVPTAASENLGYTPYFQGCVNGILNEAERLDQDVLIFTRYDTKNAEKLADSLLDGRVDGAIFLAPETGSEVFDFVESHDIPFVVLSSEHPTAPVFNIDNRGGVRVLVDHIVSLGHKKIAHIAGLPKHIDGIERKEAFIEAMACHGLEVPESMIVQGNFTTEGGYDAATNLFATKDLPTAIFAANDESAAGAIRAARENGLMVPDDVSIVGFDDAPVSSMTYPTITTIRQPWEEMSRAGLRVLVEMIEGHDPCPPQPFQTSLILRASTTRPKEDTRS